ncbi:MAG: hypothetical protein Q4C49_04075 [Bacillota bacterium]|nr:hypothetical protein [Bacillota bacterium]
MNFKDIDFSKVSQILNSMSDEEKENLANMAQDMMKNMNKPQEEEVEEEAQDMYSFLNIEEEEYADLPGTVLDEMEQASELEQYYEDVKESDFSASALFYGKAVLNMCRKYQYPIFSNLFDGFKNVNMTTLYNYYFVLMNDENIRKLSDEGFGNQQDWIQVRLLLQQMYILVNRAEYDTIRYEDIQSIKNILFDQKGLLLVKECI